MTDGDDLADVDIMKLLDFHWHHQCLATMTAITPPGRFRAPNVDSNYVKKFVEKPAGDEE